MSPGDVVLGIGCSPWPSPAFRHGMAKRLVPAQAALGGWLQRLIRTRRALSPSAADVREIQARNAAAVERLAAAFAQARVDAVVVAGDEGWTRWPRHREHLMPLLTVEMLHEFEPGIATPRMETMTLAQKKAFSLALAFYFAVEGRNAAFTPILRMGTIFSEEERRKFFAESADLGFVLESLARDAQLPRVSSGTVGLDLAASLEVGRLVRGAARSVGKRIAIVTASVMSGPRHETVIDRAVLAGCRARADFSRARDADWARHWAIPRRCGRAPSRPLGGLPGLPKRGRTPGLLGARLLASCLSRGRAVRVHPEQGG